MHSFESVARISALTAEDLYKRISDFNQFRHLMPEQVTDWISETDTCSFRITGMADIRMKFAERNPGSDVRIVSVESPFPFEITIRLWKKPDESGVYSQIVLSAELNPMLSMLASRPMKHLVDTMGSQLAEGFQG